MPSSRRQNDFGLLAYADLGIRLAVVAGLFSYLGFRLDAWLDTGPWLLLVGCLVGFGAGMYSVVHAVSHMGKRPPQEAPPEETPEEEASDEPH